MFEFSNTRPLPFSVVTLRIRPTRPAALPDHAAGVKGAVALRPSGAARRRVMALSLATALGFAAGCSDAQTDENSVSLEYARAEHESGRAVLIDIREPQEHATGVAAGAQLLPMRQLGQRLGEIPTDPSRPVLLICNTQNRSSATLRALREHGYGHVRYVNGGMSEWARRGWPMVKPGG